MQSPKLSKAGWLRRQEMFPFLCIGIGIYIVHRSPKFGVQTVGGEAVGAVYDRAVFCQYGKFDISPAYGQSSADRTSPARTGLSRTYNHFSSYDSCDRMT